MKFYELPPAIDAVLEETSVRPFARVCFMKADGTEVYVKDSDILSCVITSYKSSEGGIINAGKIILNNSKDLYSIEADNEYTTDLNVLIWYAFGNSENCYLRFNLFVDKNGFQVQETGFNEKTTTIKLVDLSVKMDNASLQKNWTDSEVAVHKVVCDKTQPEKSLVHIIAKRAGIEARDINCGELPFNIAYVVIENTAWKELCALARAYNACVECGKDQTLSFIESPYDLENEFSEDSGFFLNEKNITHYRFFNNNESYANNIRLKYTRYVETQRQELWTYSDAPVWYDENMNPYYPFTGDTREIIKDNDYQAIYTAKNGEGKSRNVVYAEEVTTAEDFLRDMVVDGENRFSLVQYDTTTYRDRAVIQLDRNDNLIGLYKASIYGKAIISETNFCVFVKDENEIAEHGQISKNVTSKYLSDDEFDGLPFYERRARDYLAESKKDTKGYYVTTFLPLIHARVDACMDMRLKENGNIKKVRIEQLTFRYKKDEAFSSEFFVKTV